MVPKRRVTHTVTLPPVSRPPLLDGNESNLRDLDIGTGTCKLAERKQDFSWLHRHTGSLPDLRPPNAKANLRKRGSKPGERKESRDEWPTEKRKSPSMVSRINDSQIPSTSLPINFQRTSMRFRANDILLTRPATIAIVVKYQLGQYELKKFKTCFKQIDLDSSGLIDCDEFFEFIDETKSPFFDGLFRMIDADSNGTIDFEEFIHALVLYCMYTRDEILRFAFNTFDPSASGYIGDNELQCLVSMVNDGQSKLQSKITNASTELDRNKPSVIDFDAFKSLHKRFPMLLFPYFRLQDRMQKATLGDRHWLQLHKLPYERHKIEKHQRKHSNALPRLTLISAFVKFLRRNHRDVYQP